MALQWKHIVGVAACGLLLTGCSSGSGHSDRVRLAPSTNAAVTYHQPNERRQMLPQLGAGRSHGNTQFALMAAPNDDRGGGLPWRPFSAAPKLLSPARPATPLRRFAAMPRHKPHAPHVRQSEASCLKSGIVRETRFVQLSDPVGNGACRISRPFEMAAAANGSVRLEPPATLRCQMVPSVEAWVKDTLRPAARHYLGSEVAEVRIAGSYGCRTRNSKAGAKLSEHGRANAVDISGFRLANGDDVTVKHGWRGSENVRRFLRYVHRGACEHFSTVLGPNADRYHHDHFHFDLASHGRMGSYRVCK